MRACALMGPAETEGLVSTLRRGSLRGTRTSLWPLDRLSLAVHVCPVVGAVVVGFLWLLRMRT
jgi:hypothetical protein